MRHDIITNNDTRTVTKATLPVSTNDCFRHNERNRPHQSNRTARYYVRGRKRPLEKAEKRCNPQTKSCETLRRQWLLFGGRRKESSASILSRRKSTRRTPSSAAESNGTRVSEWARALMCVCAREIVPFTLTYFSMYCWSKNPLRWLYINACEELGIAWENKTTGLTSSIQNKRNGTITSSYRFLLRKFSWNNTKNS